MNEKWDKLCKKWFTGGEPTKEEIEKYFEEGTGIPVSFHWEDIGGSRERGVLTPIKKNIKVLTDFEKVLGNGQPVNFQIKGLDGELKKVSKEEFANWMTEEKEEKNIKTPLKESLVYGASGDIDGTTYFTERKGKNRVVKGIYHEPRSEEEKNQIIERNKAQREREKTQLENSENAQISKQEYKEKKDNHTDYPSWTQEQLITEINRLKAENKELENNQTLTDSEKENRIKQNQQALDKLESNMLNNSVSDTDNKDPNGIGVKGWIGITGGVGLLGLVVAMVIKNKRK